MTNKLKTAILLSALLALLLFASAYAFVITIDGDPSEWPSDSHESFINGLEQDPDSIAPGVDIAEYWATNDGNNLYYRIDTWNNTDWDNIQVVAVCMDVEAETHTSCGAGWGCDSAADFALVIDPLTGTPALLDAETCNPVPGAVPDVFSAGYVTEMSVPLAGIGVNATNCSPGCFVLTQIILQYGLDPSDSDLLPDTGYFYQRVGEDSPTSLGLVSFSAGSTQPGGALELSQVFTLAATLLMLAVVIAWRRALTTPS